MAFPINHAYTQTQNDINVEAQRKADAVNRDVDKELRKLSISGIALRSKLDESQELFKNFRKAHLNSIFPLKKDEDYRPKFGSIYGLCCANYEYELNSWRLKELKQFSSVAKTAVSDADQKSFDASDKELNNIYSRVLKSKARTFPLFISNLRKAEVAWIAFRDADADAYQTYKNNESAKLSKMTELTKERSIQLNKWITGVEEGDTCMGTYPLKQ